MRTPRHDYSSYAYIAIALAGLLLIGMFVKQRRETKALMAVRSSQRQKTLPPAAGRQAAIPNAASTGQPTQAGARPVVNSQLDAGAQLRDKIDQDSLKILRDFNSAARLDFKMPQKMQVLPFEMDENMAGIQGNDKRTGTRLVALAYPVRATNEQALGFFKSQVGNFPGAEGAHLQSLGAAAALPNNPSSGLSGGQMWSGQLSNGKEVHVVFLPRSDEKGSYMFIYSAPPAYFQHNDGAFDTIYDSLRALPGR